LAFRSVVMGRRGIVASSHPLASLAGVKVMMEGGGVVDAAITVNAVLAVVQPHACGLGGDLFALLHIEGESKVRFLDASGPAPRALSLELLADRGLTGLPERGPLPVTVPGCVEGWRQLYERYGSMPLKRLLADAVHYASEGFPASHLLARIVHRLHNIIGTDPSAARIFPPDLSPGQLVVQPGLARTLRLLAEQGFDEFYRGSIAREIVRVLSARGGVLTLEDLESFRARWGEPVSTTYRGLEVYETAPPSQGFVALQALNFLEGYRLSGVARYGAEYFRLMVAALRWAYRDRDRYLGDPDDTSIPLGQLLSKEYASEGRRLVSINASNTGGEGDTTYFAVADGEGNCVSLVQSLYYSFGSGIMAGDTGIWLHNRGACFSVEEHSPNRLRGGRRPRHTLTAALALHRGAPQLVLGSMGGHAQPQIHLQLLTNLIDFGLNPQEAVEAPRFRTMSGALHLEERIKAQAADLERELKDATIVWEPPLDLGMGDAHIVAYDQRSGALMGGSDPRGDGATIAW
jgi:gamma-glutamyltranspeptidase/glutathione hydrolase